MQKALVNRQKICYYIRFNNGSRTMFMNTGEVNCFFIILIMFSKHDQMSWKLQEILTSCISFVMKHICMHVTHFIQVA